MQQKFEQHAQNAGRVKDAADGTLGLGALSSPVWLQYLESSLGLFMLAGGALLLALRIYLTIREIREKRKPQS